MGNSIWQQCLNVLAEELATDQFDTYIKPLQTNSDDGSLSIYAPNIYVEEEVRQTYLERIRTLIAQASGMDEAFDISLSVGEIQASGPLRADASGSRLVTREEAKPIEHNLNHGFTFDTFVEGKSNELAKAAALHAAASPGRRGHSGPRSCGCREAGSPPGRRRAYR